MHIYTYACERPCTELCVLAHEARRLAPCGAYAARTCALPCARSTPHTRHAARTRPVLARCAQSVLGALVRVTHTVRMASAHARIQAQRAIARASARNCTRACAHDIRQAHDRACKDSACLHAARGGHRAQHGGRAARDGHRARLCRHASTPEAGTALGMAKRAARDGHRARHGGHGARLWRHASTRCRASITKRGLPGIARLAGHRAACRASRGLPSCTRHCALRHGGRRLSASAVAKHNPGRLAHEQAVETASHILLSWPSGLRRETQVLFLNEGVGSNPTDSTDLI